MTSPETRPGTRPEARRGGLLELRDVAVTYRSAAGDVPAVRGVSLELAEGEALGVAGESGSGKSTLALALLRLLPKTARVTGEIMLDGEDVLAMTWGRLRAVRWASASVVFQGAQHALNPVRRVGTQIAEPLLVHRMATPARARTRVTELLEQVGLPAWRARSYPHELSGGQRQRVMIAMALACEPQLIIADEPTTALDVMIQAQVLTLIRSLIAGRGISLIMISHDLSVLAATCDRLAVMYAGRLVETGPSREVFTGARHPYSRALAEAFPTVGDFASRMAPRGLGGDPPDPMRLPGGCSFHPRCPVALPSCAWRDVELWPADRAPEEPASPASSAPSHTAACVHVLPDPEAGPEPETTGEDETPAGRPAKESA
ncbi:ABC transporter ATP-binding protein [Planobispora longispora]|uniref:Dipeptide/oligopeptide/nickel ABC transporter ATP-binding protein n=1 Tax=Planobispora longispora TaxID=28887 RepID=A0A8J3W6I8_9ACTN|nr:ABC transporter ATP-binding protein [Planobispora longispora]GIH77750.1 dipeptide/oligopeptide/nickel ABC transporter ATP-binding protein [Planobispora longispora]